MGPGAVTLQMLAADAPGLEIRELVFGPQVVRRMSSLLHISFVRSATCILTKVVKYLFLNNLP